jgi:drug/metabolite transporter (DMT)-like permease
MTRTRRLALTEGISAGILFGTAAIFIRYLPNLSAFSIAFWRLVIACLALAVLLVLLRRSFSFALVKKNLLNLLFLSLFLGLHFIFFISAVKDTTILNATVLVNLTPIFSVFISSFVFKLKPTYFAVAGLTISFIGVAIIACAETLSGGGISGAAMTPSLKGDVEAILASFVESFYLNFGRGVRKEMNILSIMIPIYFFTAIIVGLIAVPISSSFNLVPFTIETVLLLVGLGLLPTAIAHTLYFSSLSNLKSFETATMALLEPIGATILGIFLFQEIPGSFFILGASLILAGIFFIIGIREKEH